MKIFERIKTGKLKGWTIRVSKHGWYDLYSSSGISQTTGKHTLEAIRKVIKDLENENTTTKPMSNKKQTSVEWLVQRLIDRLNQKDNPNFRHFFTLDQIFDHAIKMEKQQIIDAHINGHNAPSSTLKQYDAEQYYKETYEQ
jgi:ribosomal silencing factor RsfS